MTNKRQNLWALLRHGLPAWLRWSQSKPIFVFGCGHSGTTLTATILGSHPNVALIPSETWAFTGLQRRNLASPLIVPRLRLFSDLALHHGKLAKPYFLEKTPKHVLSFDVIRRSFRRARFVYCVRDPRDSVASFIERGHSLEQAVARWLRDNAEFARLMNESAVQILRYEKLVNSPEETVGQLTDWLGLTGAFDPTVYWRTAPDWFGLEQGSAVEAARPMDALSHEERRNAQVHRPISTASVGRFRRDLSSGQVSAVEAMTNSLASTMGYVDDEWGS